MQAILISHCRNMIFLFFSWHACPPEFINISTFFMSNIFFFPILAPIFCHALYPSLKPMFFFFFKSLFYFYWGVALCWKLKLRGVCMYVGFLCLCRCRAWSMTTRCKSRCGEVYACEANGWWCQVGCGRGGPGVVVSTIGAVGIRGGSVMYVVYIYISGRSRWVK